MSPRPTTDPRVYAATRALAEAMGALDDWRQFIPEARAALQAADSVDPLREEAA